jgi:hypothetical protein
MITWAVRQFSLTAGANCAIPESSQRRHSDSTLLLFANGRVVIGAGAHR